MTNQRVAILGSGSWATALAKIVLAKEPGINWYMRRQEAIDEFRASGRNRYLNAAYFDTERIGFSTDINAVIGLSEIIILAIPSPFVKQTLKKIKRSLRKKIVITAVKGMIPEDNVIVTDYLHQQFQIPKESLAIIAGPCHAEEIALERLSYLTIGCVDLYKAKQICELFNAPYVHTTPSTDVDGLEYSSVMKNIYAIAAGLCTSLRYGDNFQAVLLSNAIQEIRRFAMATSPTHRDVGASGYLGDVMVTSYSRFSRNRQFGQMIGMGYSVKVAQMEMEMIAEGYYGTYSIHKANEQMHVSLPIVDAIYDILYNRMSPAIRIKQLTEELI